MIGGDDFAASTIISWFPPPTAPNPRASWCRASFHFLLFGAMKVVMGEIVLITFLKGLVLGAYGAIAEWRDQRRKKRLQL